MSVNNQPVTGVRVQIGSEPSLISLNETQIQFVSKYSRYLRRLINEAHTERRPVQLSIDVADRERENFDYLTIRMFFDIFRSQSGQWNTPRLDPDTLVKLCRVFRWLRCDRTPLAESPAVIHLRGDIQNAAWRSSPPKSALIIYQCSSSRDIDIFDVLP